MIYRTIISQYENRLEAIKEKVSNEEMICYFAQDHVEKLLEEEKRLKVVFKEMHLDVEIIEELDSVIKQTEQFLLDIVDIIEIERNKCF